MSLILSSLPLPFIHRYARVKGWSRIGSVVLGLPLDDSTFFDICLARGSMALASLPPSLSSSDGSNKESTLTKFPLLNTPLFTFTRKCSYLPPSLTLSTILAYTLHSTCSPLPRPHRRHSPSISDPTIFPLINRFCFDPSFGSLLGEYICNYPITTSLWRLFLPTTHAAMASSNPALLHCPAVPPYYFYVIPFLPQHTKHHYIEIFGTWSTTLLP